MSSQALPYSKTLFKENLYGRGVVRRLITNGINTGLELEAVPDESTLGLADDTLAGWSEKTENRFALWGNNPILCDFQEKRTWGALEADAYREALIDGDVLVVLRQVKGLIKTQLVNGSLVQTPADTKNKNIKHGVELDASGRHVAFHIQQDDGTSKRLPAFDKKTGRRVAWPSFNPRPSVECRRSRTQARPVDAMPPDSDCRIQSPS